MLNTAPLPADDVQVSRAHQRLSGERGFTLIEVIVAATILVVGVLGLVTMLDGANRTTARTKAREAGVNLAREAIEAARAVPYPDLVPAQVEGEIRSQPGLADASAETGWQIRRRDIEYTLSVNVCSVDDGTTADGYGDHTGGFFCADSNVEGALDTNPDDYKRVTLNVTWKDGTQTRTARQEAVINNPGSAFAPAIKALVSNPVSPLTNETVKNIDFTATASSRATAAKWSLDNVVQGDATSASGAGLTWNFNWDITNVVDGTYLVGAEAFDAFGESGTGRVLTMVLNRYAPSTPTGLTGGRNELWANVTEFEWDPNPERDVTGYRLYRIDDALGLAAPSAADTPVCETAVEDANFTTCMDTSTPASGVLRYYVVALAPARVGAGVEESARPAVAYTVTPNVRPSAPPNVWTVTDGAGNVTIHWDAASDPDGSIRYYRVYRDDDLIAGRLDRTSNGSDTELTDSQGGSTSHQYWVTAVDDRLAESDLAGPVP
jgi:prepilin-type N-terminal cleavage/methylation domain-containing protein